MTYEQTQAVFNAMDELETYAKMYCSAMAEPETDWDAVDRYNDYITVARKKIFNLVEAHNAE